VGDGEEIARRSENLGHPVGKSASTAERHPQPYTEFVYSGDPSAQPVLICKILKGQELRVRCIAKKVKPCTAPLGDNEIVRSSVGFAGRSEGTRKVTTMFRGLL
jgi:hypothetical protein